MPAYVSHTIMAKDVYNKLNNKNVNLDYMLTFSLGGDLCKYAKCRYDSHHKLLNEFIYNMCDYMINNNLTSDGECLGVLYGHICHYVMDSEMHPLIRKIDSSCIKDKKNHTMIELYYDNYFSSKKYKVKLNKYDNKKIFKGKMNRKISKMINYVYLETYNTKNVAFYYIFNIWLYKKIKYLYKLFSFNFLKKISGINTFLNNNKQVDLLNSKRKICYRIDGKECNSNADFMYKSSVTKAVNYIKKVNLYMKEKSNLI
ncbi:MAG: hypothetical protein IKR57_00865 [Bacilli bacterium]|nr:hypothetical protein [Bacilli bacterium]